MPIPNKNCNHSTHAHCRCRYLSLPKRDQEGNLILKLVASEEELKRQQAIAAYQKVTNKKYSNTAYGRRKERERVALYRKTLTPEERKEFDINTVVVFIVIVIIVIIILYAIGGEKAVFKWMQR